MCDKCYLQYVSTMSQAFLLANLFQDDHHLQIIIKVIVTE